MVSFWHIWDARNKSREGEGMLNPSCIAAKIKVYVELISTFLYKPPPLNRCEPSSSTPKWVLPLEGTVFVNVDKATFASTRKMGVGIVVRDHNGNIIVACGEQINEVIIPEMVEALAIRRAISFSLDEGFSRVIIGLDCLVVQRIGSSMSDRSLCGPVIEDVKLAKSLESCVFHHVYGVLNVAAHNLARECEFSSDAVWRGVPPVGIQEAICVMTL
jgi:hypothetical protein